MRHSRGRGKETERVPTGFRVFLPVAISFHPLQVSPGCSVSPRPFSLPLRSTLMQSEDMRRRRRRRRRRRHDPAVDQPEDASCKNKRTGSLGMSRDSVLYRSPAYIDTNLCPPQAVLCICRIYIHRPSRTLDFLLCLTLIRHPVVLLLSFALGFSPFRPLRRCPLTTPFPHDLAPSRSQLASLSVRDQASLAPSRVQRRVSQHAYGEVRSLHPCLCCATPGPPPPAPPSSSLCARRGTCLRGG